LLLKIDELLEIIEELTPKHKDYNPKSPKYKKLDFDKLPVVKEFAMLDYRELISRCKELWGETIKPVKSRSGTFVPNGITCLCCRAPHKYFYDNSGGRGQILCKICSYRFSRDKQFVSPVSLFCPYCGRSLSKKM